MTFRHTIRNITLASMLVGVLSGAQTVNAQDATAAAATAPTPQVLTMLGRSNGFNGTKWISEIYLANNGDTAATGKLIFFDSNPGSDDTNPSMTYSVNPHGTATIVDPIGTVGLNGNYAVKIQPDAGTPQVGVTARTWNEQDKDNNPATTTQLSQYLNARSISDFLEPGDRATFTLSDSTLQNNMPAFRFNTQIYAESTTPGEVPEALTDLYSRFGEFDGTKTITCNDHSKKQINNTVETIYGRAQLPYDKITITIVKGRWSIISTPVQNNQDLPGVDDGGVQEPTLERLVQNGTYTVAPGTIEANDPVVAHLKVQSREGTKVDGCSLYGAWEGNVTGNGTNTLTYDKVNYPTAAGNYQLKAVCGISTTDGGFLGARTFNAGTMTVTAEKNYNPTNSYQTTQTKKAEIAHLLGSNINIVFSDMKHYSEMELLNALTVYTNDTTGTNDPEMRDAAIEDKGNTYSVNFTNGQVATWGGFTEKQIDQLLIIYSVQK